MISRIWRRAYNAIDLAIEFANERTGLFLVLLSLTVMLSAIMWGVMPKGAEWAGVLIACFATGFSASLITQWRRFGQKGREHHASWAKQYDEVNERSFGKAYDSLTQATLRLVNGIGQNLSIIDFGAGTGRLSLPLAEAGHRVTAVDPSQPMLDELDRKDARNRVTKRCATIAGYRGRGNFDLALAVYTVVAYITDEAALKASLLNIYDKLKPGGALVIDVPGRILFQDGQISRDGITRSIRFVEKGDELYEYQEETQLEADGKVMRYSDTALLRRWKEDQVIAALRSAGFQDIERATDMEMAEADFDALRLSGAVYLICRKPTPTTSGKFWKSAGVLLLWAIMASSIWNSHKRHAAEDMRKAIAVAIQAKNTRELKSLGWAYKKGHEVEQSDMAAFKCWSEAAKLGDADAQAFVARAIYNGRGTPQDKTEGLKMARLSAESGSAEGEFALAHIFYLKYAADHRDEDGASAFKWASKAANRRHPSAMMLLASMHKKGVGTQADGAEAYKWIWLWRDIARFDNQRDISDEVRSTIEDTLSPEEMSEGRRRAEFAVPILNGEK